MKQDHTQSQKKIKQEIIDIFRKKIKGKNANDEIERKHAGSEGHWLESQFSIEKNSSKDCDYKGYEIKTYSRHIDIFDCIAHEYLFKATTPILTQVNGNRNLKMDKNTFIRYFGYPNEKKQNRFSWSGRATPKYNEWNACGQILVICPNSNNIYVIYSYKKDKRVTASDIPDIFKTNYIAIAVWYADILNQHIDRKWNQNGSLFFKKDLQGNYVKLIFGKPFDFSFFIDSIKKKRIIFDSGMVENQNRSRSGSKFRVVDTQNFLTSHIYDEEFN